MDENIKIVAETDDSALDETNEKAEKTEEKVNKTVEESETKLDLTMLKTIQTVQKINGIVSQSLRLAGISLDEVTQTVIDTVFMAISTLYPIFTAQSMTGWQTAQAILGIIALGQATVKLGMLAKQKRKAMLATYETTWEIGKFVDVSNVMM